MRLDSQKISTSFARIFYVLLVFM